MRSNVIISTVSETEIYPFTSLQEHYEVSLLLRDKTKGSYPPPPKCAILSNQPMNVYIHRVF